MSRRERSRVETPEFNDLIQTQQGGGGFTQSYNTYKSDEFMEDHVTSNFHTRISRGDIINNPCRYSVSSRTSFGSGSMRGERNSDGWWFAQEGPTTLRRNVPSRAGPYLPAHGLTASEIEDRAKLLALSNIDATPYAFGEDIGELGETIRFIRRPMSSLLRLSKSFKRRRATLQQKYSDRSKAIAEAWLEYRFAASPLVKSAFDAVDAYSYSQKALPERLSSRGFADDDLDFQGPIQWGSAVTSSLTTADFLWEKTENGHAAILYEVSNPVRDWRFRLGLRAKDIPVTVWQLLPYSFMVDRVSDVSSFIKGATNLLDPSVRILAASYTRKSGIRTESQVTSIEKNGWTYTTDCERVEENNFVYERNPWTPSVADLKPGFTPGRLTSTLTSTADLLALIRANFR